MAESGKCRAIFYETLDRLNNARKKSEDEHKLFVIEINQRMDIFYKKIQKYIKTGDIHAADLIEETNSDSDQENVPVKKTRGRKKKVLTETTEDNLQEVKIKKEKISTGTLSSRVGSSVASSTVSSTPDIPLEEIKKEMPAPSWIPPKKKVKEIKAERTSVRSTRTRGKKNSVRDSDVIVQNAVVTTINLSDTDDSESDKAETKEKATRSSRIKTKKAKADCDSGTETDTESTRSTRTKTRIKQTKETLENNDMEPPRSTRTKTIKKGKKDDEERQEVQPEAPQEIRSTRSRQVKKETKAKVQEEEEEIPSGEPTKTTKIATDHDLKKNNAERNESRKSKEILKESVLKAVPKPTNQGKAKRPRSNTSSDDDVKKSKEDRSDSRKTKELRKESVLKAVPKPTNQSKAKKQRSDASSDEQGNDKGKSVSPVQSVEANATAQTVYEDASSTYGAVQDQGSTHLNCTYVAGGPTASGVNTNTQVPPMDANSTVVLDKPQFTLFAKNSMDGILTDDDSIELKKTPPKKATTTKAGKEVFSPYEKSSLKKKVEAFERLHYGSEIPVKAGKSSRNPNTPSTVKEKAKMFTPLGSTFMPASSSTAKISRFLSSQQNSISNDSLSAMKMRTESAQKESRDRQKKHLEREQALKKKEAMLLAQAEAKRKLNEEKQLRAQQQRKLLDAERLKQLEIQKQKEAKLKQREREREEHVQKQKLELEKRRQEQKKKQAEILAHRKQVLEEQASNPPIYMTTRLPRLPTEDCYDSDDPDYRPTDPPEWCRSEKIKRTQLIMLAAGEKIKNTLFCRRAQTPDLVAIFEVIDPRKLKRSSSVLWRPPPRYTMMPNLDETKFEEDDEIYDSD